jgi:hypothetical protein
VVFAEGFVLEEAEAEFLRVELDGRVLVQHEQTDDCDLVGLFLSVVLFFGCFTKPKGVS